MEISLKYCSFVSERFMLHEKCFQTIYFVFHKGKDPPLSERAAHSSVSVSVGPSGSVAHTVQEAVHCNMIVPLLCLL